MCINQKSYFLKKNYIIIFGFFLLPGSTLPEVDPDPAK